MFCQLPQTNCQSENGDWRVRFLPRGGCFGAVVLVGLVAVVGIKKLITIQTLALSAFGHGHSLTESDKQPQEPPSTPKAKCEENEKKTRRRRVKNDIWKKTEPEENARSFRLNHGSFSPAVTPYVYHDTNKVAKSAAELFRTEAVVVFSTSADQV
jgi:hypothetical protein